MTRPCPAPDELRQFAVGNLAHPAWQELSQHVEHCT
jgi:hypothetical protein